ncbi:MAG: ABC transporter ATP-binding protein, partial [Cetobacterium sp.]
GERQRVIFSKVLAQETEIILFDEPTSSMDIYNQEQIFRICKTLSQEGKTIVTAIHDIRMAAKYCDKLLLLKAGEVIAFGNVEEVLTKANLKKSYSVDTKVYRNEISGKIDYYIY